MNEIFKNGVAWFIGATISGLACVNFLIIYIQNLFN